MATQRPPPLLNVCRVNSIIHALSRFDNMRRIISGLTISYGVASTNITHDNVNVALIFNSSDVNRVNTLIYVNTVTHVNNAKSYKV